MRGVSPIMMYVYFFLFLCLYGLACYYVAFNGYRWLKRSFGFGYRRSYTIIIIFLSVAFIASFIVSSRLLELIGGYWLTIVGYGLLLLPLVNLIYFLSGRKPLIHLLSGYILSFCFLCILIVGSFNAWSPTIRYYDVSLTEEPTQEIRFLLGADFHFGTVIGMNHFERFLQLVEQESPDAIFLAGDIIDDNMDTFIEEQIADGFLQLDAPLGVYAVPGNHDYYGGDLSLLTQELRSSGVTVLLDEHIHVDGLFTVIGRKDETDIDRKSIAELMEHANEQLPIIMMDHQPHETVEAATHNVDMIFSGHTHRGQLFPGNLLTQAIYENDWGYKQIDQLHSFTTSGFGFWGPALRIGSRSEIIMITVKL